MHFTRLHTHTHMMASFMDSFRLVCPKIFVVYMALLIFFGTFIMIMQPG